MCVNVCACTLHMGMCMVMYACVYMFCVCEGSHVFLDGHARGCPYQRDWASSLISIEARSLAEPRAHWITSFSILRAEGREATKRSRLFLSSGDPHTNPVLVHAQQMLYPWCQPLLSGFIESRDSIGKPFLFSISVQNPRCLTQT